MGKPKPTHGGRRKGAGRKPLPDGEARSERLVVRVTETELATYAAAAERSGMSVPDFARGALDAVASRR
jgi:hypothetical protein